MTEDKSLWLTDLFLHEIEAHGYHGDAKEEVETAESYPLLPVHCVLLVWCEVPEANGGEGDEAEVGAVQEGPALPHLEEEGSPPYVDNHQEDGEEDGHRLPAVVCSSIVFTLLVVEV